MEPKTSFVRHIYNLCILENFIACNSITVPLGDITFRTMDGLIGIPNQERRRPMFVVAIVICLLVFAVIAGADLLVANINSDELSNMGVERKS